MSPAPIIDQFTAWPVSRRRKYQLRKAAQGLCVVCGQIAKHGLQHGNKHPHCDKHWELFKNRKRDVNRRTRARKRKVFFREPEKETKIQ